jgi:hypothetical protein
MAALVRLGLSMGGCTTSLAGLAETDVVLAREYRQWMALRSISCMALVSRL